MDYTDSEVREELARLGYRNLTEDQLMVFKMNLMKLIRSERNRKSSVETRSNDQETGGNISNHGNQWLDNTSDYSANWKNGELGRSYSALSSAGRTYSTSYSPPDAGMAGFRSPNYSSDLHMAGLRGASSELNIRPKSVKWSLDRDSVKLIPADEKRPINNEKRSVQADIRENSHVEEGDNPLEEYDNEEFENQASTYPGSYEGYRAMVRKIPGIITRKEHPHTRNLVRTKPFERHQMYMRVWKARPPVGEASRSLVCREVHNKLLRKEEVVRTPVKALTPNQYIVPTDKPRYELRWAVRQCNENYEMPPCGFFHES